MLRPLESLKSERFAPLAMEECHCWIGNSEEGFEVDCFEVDCFEVDCFEVDWPNDCSAPKKVNAMSSVREVRASMRKMGSVWREGRKTAANSYGPKRAIQVISVDTAQMLSKPIRFTAW